MPLCGIASRVLSRRLEYSLNTAWTLQRTCTGNLSKSRGGRESYMIIYSRAFSLARVASRRVAIIGRKSVAFTSPWTIVDIERIVNPNYETVAAIMWKRLPFERPKIKHELEIERERESVRVSLRKETSFGTSRLFIETLYRSWIYVCVLAYQGPELIIFFLPYSRIRSAATPSSNPPASCWIGSATCDVQDDPWILHEESREISPQLDDGFSFVHERRKFLQFTDWISKDIQG